jgi:DNA invertase Pin-like site-specific DNA recombinase
VRIILIETANRLARDLFEQETGYQYLKRPGISLIAVDDPDSLTGDTPTSNLIRQILGAVAEFEKATLVAKLKGSRDRKGAMTGRCEGRKPAPKAARKLAGELHSTGISLRDVANQLAAAGHYAPSGKVCSASSIKAIVR